MPDRYVVVDTNVLLSALITPNGSAARAFSMVLQKYRPAMSHATPAELAAKMWSPKFGRWATPVARSRFFAHAVMVSDLIDPVPPVTVADDPDDDAFLALAAAIEARFLVTGDKALHALESYGGTDIVTPAEFLKRHG